MRSFEVKIKSRNEPYVNGRIRYDMSIDFHCAPSLSVDMCVCVCCVDY